MSPTFLTTESSRYNIGNFLSGGTSLIRSSMHLTIPGADVSLLSSASMVNIDITGFELKVKSRKLSLNSATVSDTISGSTVDEPMFLARDMVWMNDDDAMVEGKVTTMIKRGWG